MIERRQRLHVSLMIVAKVRVELGWGMVVCGLSREVLQGNP